MTRSTISFERVLTDGNYATPHGATIQGYEPIDLSVEGFVTPIAPSGAIWSTPSEMAEFVKMMLAGGLTSDGTRLLSEGSIERLWTAQVPISATTNYGLGWILEEYKKLPVYGHGGNTLGFTSDMVLLPGANLGFVMLTNQQGSVLNALVRQRFLELVYAQEDKSSGQLASLVRQIGEGRSSAAERLQDSVDLAVLEPYFGTYSNAELGTLVLGVNEDGRADR